MKHIINFIKLISIVLNIECILLISEFIYAYLQKRTTIHEIPVEVIALIGLSIAFWKKYFVFSKNNIKQNVISIIFILCFLVFMWISGVAILLFRFSLTMSYFD